MGCQGCQSSYSEVVMAKSPSPRARRPQAQEYPRRSAQTRCGQDRTRRPDGDRHDRCSARPRRISHGSVQRPRSRGRRRRICAGRPESSHRIIDTLDTNVLIDALRRPADRLQLKEFSEWALPHTTLSSVVASELSASTRTECGSAGEDLPRTRTRGHRVNWGVVAE